MVFIVTLYLLSILAPGGDLADSVASDIAKTIGGNVFGAIFLAALVCQQFTAGIAAQASSARLMYAMGRDAVFPRKFFAKLSDRFLTPVNGILVCGVVGLGAIWLTLAVSTSFINFGAFLGFTMVNASVIAYFIRNRHEKKLNPLVFVVSPALGAIIDIVLLFALDSTAQLIGCIWLALGVLYLAVLTRGFRRPPPELSDQDTNAESTLSVSRYDVVVVAVVRQAACPRTGADAEHRAAAGVGPQHDIRAHIRTLRAGDIGDRHLGVLDHAQ